MVHSVHSVEPVHSHHSSHSSSSNSLASTPVDTKSSGQTVADLLSTNPKFSTLLTAVQAAGLMETLRQPGQLTVFAPTNTAFDKVEDLSWKYFLLIIILRSQSMISTACCRTLRS